MFQFFACIFTDKLAPTELIAEPGEQKSNNLTSGTTNSLRVSTSSSFGTNVSASTSGRFSTVSTSNLKLDTLDSNSKGPSYISTFGSTTIMMELAITVSLLLTLPIKLKME